MKEKMKVGIALLIVLVTSAGAVAQEIETCSVEEVEAPCLTESFATFFAQFRTDPAFRATRTVNPLPYTAHDGNTAEAVVRQVDPETIDLGSLESDPEAEFTFNGLDQPEALALDDSVVICLLNDTEECLTGFFERGDDGLWRLVAVETGPNP